MRAALALFALLAVPTLAVAQTAPPPPARGGPITRDQFVQRAAAMAAERFDQIDSGHTGTITRAQLREWRQSHKGQGRGGQGNQTLQ